YQVPVLGGTARRVLTGINTSVTFSPDGKHIAFLYFYEDEDRLMIANADGTGERQVAERHGNEFFYLGAFSALSWSPDGKTLACRRCRLRRWPTSGWRQPVITSTRRNSHPAGT